MSPVHRALNLSLQQPSEFQQEGTHVDKDQWSAVQNHQGSVWASSTTQSLSVPASCQQNGDIQVAERVNGGTLNKAYPWWCMPITPMIPAAEARGAGISLCSF